MPSRTQEVWHELRTMLLTRQGVGDSLVPPIVFLALRPLFGWRWGAIGALLLGGLITVLRWRGGQKLVYALGGMASTLVAVGLALVWGQAAAFFLPGLFGALVTALVAIVSALAKRPLVALTSHVARRWPLAWYWHPQVRPAYSEVTWFWGVFSVGRAWLQNMLLADSERLGWLLIATGWPLTLILLVLSYLYGSWRLGTLCGPSVDEFSLNTPPPWQGQRQGF